MSTLKVTTRRTLLTWLDILLPAYCALCNSPVKMQKLCDRCLARLPRNRRFCFRCGRPVAAELPIDVFCAQCQSRPPPFAKARAPMIYAFPISQALKALKFRRQLWHAPALAELMLPILAEEFSHCDALLPVPLHRWRHARRGFNQAEELCRPLRRATGLRILTDIKRSRATRQQSGLSAAERQRNLEDAFDVVNFLPCRHPLIVDDVITTGSTVCQFANALLRSGAESVSVIAVARADQFGAKIGSGTLKV